MNIEFLISLISLICIIVFGTSTFIFQLLDFINKIK